MHFHPQVFSPPFSASHLRQVFLPIKVVCCKESFTRVDHTIEAGRTTAAKAVNKSPIIVNKIIIGWVDTTAYTITNMDLAIRSAVMAKFNKVDVTKFDGDIVIVLDRVDQGMVIVATIVDDIVTVMPMAMAMAM